PASEGISGFHCPRYDRPSPLIEFCGRNGVARVLGCSSVACGWSGIFAGTEQDSVLCLGDDLDRRQLGERRQIRLKRQEQRSFRLRQKRRSLLHVVEESDGETRIQPGAGVAAATEDRTKRDAQLGREVGGERGEGALRLDDVERRGEGDGQDDG